MATKIIDKIPTKPIYQGECKICGSHFEFNHSDVIARGELSLEGFCYLITCPKCNKKTWVNKNILLRYDL